MSKIMPPEFYQMLEEMQAIDFVIVELNLYLDTHPNDLDAIKQFNHFTEKSMKLKVQFEKKFGPLMNFGRSYVNYPLIGATRLGLGRFKQLFYLGGTNSVVL